MKYYEVSWLVGYEFDFKRYTVGFGLLSSFGSSVYERYAPVTGVNNILKIHQVAIQNFSVFPLTLIPVLRSVLYGKIVENQICSPTHGGGR